MTEPEALRRSVISGLRWSTVSRLATQGLTWGITLVVLRLLSPRDYGLAAQAGIVTAYIALLAELGLGVGLIQRRITDESTQRKVFGVLLVSGLLSLVVLLAFAPLIALFFREPRLVPLVRLTALQFVLMPFAVIPQARLATELRFKELGLVGLLSNALGSVVTVSLAMCGLGASSLVLGAVAISFSRSCSLNVVARFLRRPDFRWRGLGSLFRFSATVVLDRTLWYGYSQADTILVGRFLGAGALGIYAVAMQLASIPMERAAEILSSVALPAFARVNDRLDRVAAGYMKGIRVGSVLGFPIFWGIALVAPDLISGLFGSRWSEAVPVVQIICIAMPLKVLAPIAPPALMAIGRPGISIKILMVGLLTLPGAVAVGTLWGILGVATAWSCAIPVVFLAASRLVAGALELRVRSILAALLAPLLAGTFMVLVVVAVENGLADLPIGVRLLSSIVLGAVAYAIALRVLARRRLEEVTTMTLDLLSPARLRPE